MTAEPSPSSTFRVNGREERLSFEPGDRLLDLLRDDLRLVGAKDGCTDGRCRACLVLVNGEPRRSCRMTPAEAVGATIVTPEGLARSGHLSPAQRAVLASDVDAGGFRSPALAVAATALLDGSAGPDADIVDATVAATLAPHLGSAPDTADERIADLIAALRRATGDPSIPPLPAAGPGRVTGGLVLAGDVGRPGMLHAALARADGAGPGRIVRIDADAARAMPGVVAVVVGRELLDFVPYTGPIVRDTPLLAIDRVRWSGEPIAAVLATSPVTARAAAATIRVALDTSSGLPGARADDPIHLTDLLAAGPHGDPGTLVRDEGDLVARHLLSWGEPMLETAPGAQTDTIDVARFDDLEPDDRRSWFGYRQLSAHRDPAGAPAGVAQVITSATVAPTIVAGPEPHSAVAEWDGERLEVWSTSSDPFATRAELATLFGLPTTQVRVVVPALANRHEAPGALTLEGLAAALARRVRRPVRLQASAAGMGWRAPDADIRIDDRIDPASQRIERVGSIRIFAGASAGDLPRILPALAGMLAGPWRWSALRIEVSVLYSAQPPIAAPFAAWAEPLAEMSRGSLAMLTGAGHDPAMLEDRFRLQAMEPLWPGGPSLAWEVGPATAALTADGSTCIVIPPPGPARSLALLRIDGDGVVTIATAAPPLGDGSADPLAARVAGVLGIAQRAVRFAPVDTGQTPWGDPRDVGTLREAVDAAAWNLRDRLESLAAAALGGDRGEVVLSAGEARIGARVASLAALIAPLGELAALGEAGDGRAWGVATVHQDLARI